MGCTHPTGAVAAGLLRAYRMTAYRAAGVVVRVGARSAAMDAVLRAWRVRGAVFVGAANPGSRRMPEGWNRRRDAALRGVVRRWPHAPGEGRWRAWREANVLVGCPPAAGLVLARRFRQAAIVVVGRGRPASLVACRR